MIAYILRTQFEIYIQMKNLFFLTIIASLIITSCGPHDHDHRDDKKVAVKIPGIMIEHMNDSIRPQDDFYNYVNGTWLKNNDIPKDRTRWGSSDELVKAVDDDALSILKAASESGDYAKGTDQWKAINIYRSILDVDNRNKQGLEPLKPLLDQIDAVTDVVSMQELMAETAKYGGVGFFGVYVFADMKNSNMNTAYLGAGSLGLPEREYYVGDDNDSKEKRENYVAHVARMFEMIGDAPEAAADQASRILAFETSLAEPRMTKEESRNPLLRYNPMSIAELSEINPSIDWNGYLKGIGVGELEHIIVTQPKYFTALEGILKDGNVDEWKNYMRWTALNDAAGLLTVDLDKANWEFYGKELRGAEAQRPLEERALNTINGAIGEALGKLYVDEKFPPEAKEKAEKMVNNVLDAYKVRIKALNWMSPETQDKAIEKIDRLQIKIGYPNKWKDYSTVQVIAPEDGGSYFGNMLSVSEWGHNDMISKMNKEVDKTEWFMSPQTVNAYYNPMYNEIVFPAAILQPPFYNYMADEAVNYGGIGAVIGHEVSHGFDDQGSKYDADGNLNNWWTESDTKEFAELGKALVSQYDVLEPLPGINVNGEFTLGENIGDLGGVFSAFDGLQMHLKEAGDPGEIDGFTQEQRFFISWSTLWRQLIRDEALMNQIKTDPHSPGQYRGYVPILNMDEFHTAFNTQPGDPMYLAPEDRVKIW